jgi:hypothetical protein
MSNLKLPIETGRWANILKQNRKCHLCNIDIGNEFHYLFICSYPQISELRFFLIPEYYLRNPSEIEIFVFVFVFVSRWTDRSDEFLQETY